MARVVVVAAAAEAAAVDAAVASPAAAFSAAAALDSLLHQHHASADRAAFAATCQERSTKLQKTKQGTCIVNMGAYSISLRRVLTVCWDRTRACSNICC